MHKDLFTLISSKEKSTVNNLAVSIHNEVFERTDCLECGNCCKSAPPIVTKKDIKRIAKFLGESPKQIERKHVIQDINQEMSFDRIPCFFLGSDNKCSIYEARPKACRQYPHTNHGDFAKLKRLHVANLKICPAVDEILTIMERKLQELPPS